MHRVLPKNFFNRKTEIVAQELLGKYLVRRYKGKEITGMITEVEVYDGFKDKGSHASRGMTERNKIMFGPAGYWYPYFTYGMHWMVNVVTREKDYPAAILIRSIIVGNTDLYGLGDGFIQINGPGRVTKFFKIDGKLYGKPAAKSSGLWIEDRPAHRISRGGKGGGAIVKKSRIKKSPRIGINYAGEYWKNKKWRYTLECIQNASKHHSDPPSAEKNPSTEKILRRFASQDDDKRENEG